MDARTAPTRRRRSKLAARAAALGALLASAAAIAAILLDAPDGTSVAAAAPAGPQLERLYGANARLARALDKLRTGVSARPVRDAVRAAVTEHAAVRRWVRRAVADGRLESDVRLQNALGANYEYLDAVGSVLANPRSRLRRTLPDRARRARAAFAALPDPSGLPATVRGWQRLEAYTKARLS